MLPGRFTLGFTVLIACSLPAATQAEDFYFSFDAPETVEYDPDFGEAEIVVDLVLEEDEDNEDYPNSVLVWAIVGFDEDVLAVSGLELVGPLEDQDEDLEDCADLGSPCYVVEDGTLWLAADAVGFSVEKPSPILRITFDTVADELIDDTEGRVTDLVWTTLDVGFEIETMVVPDSLGFDPFDVTTTDTSIELVPLVVFKRGDVNGDGEVSAIPDALFLLRWNFSGGDEPPCMDAADCDDSGTVSGLPDALFLLIWGFGDGDTPPDPGPDDCGPDPTDDDVECLEVADECV